MAVDPPLHIKSQLFNSFLRIAAKDLVVHTIYNNDKLLDCILMCKPYRHFSRTTYISFGQEQTNYFCSSCIIRIPNGRFKKIIR